MMKVLLAISLILSVIGIAFLVILTIDALEKKKIKQSKRRIKNYTDFSSWKDSVFSCAKKWEMNMPSVRLTDNNRFVFMDIIKKQYKHSSLQGWQYAQLLAGIRSIDDTYCWKKEKINVCEIDEGYYIYKLWKSGCIGNDIDRYIKDYLAIVKKHTKENGLIEYRYGFGDICLVDTLAFACPLLVKYGISISDDSLVDEAMLQIKTYHKYGYISNFGLYSHGYDCIKGIPSESAGWGRGTGWYLFGILNCYDELPESNENKEYLKSLIKEAAVNIVKFQREDGGFSTQLISNRNYDSSATAMFALFLLRASDIVGLDYSQIAKKALDKLMSVTTSDGAIEYCEGDCHGIGKYSKLYTMSPFTQGVVLEAISLIEKMKIKG